MTQVLHQAKSAEYTLPLEISREGKWFIAQCPALDLVAQGKTAAKAVRAMSDAVDLFLKELRDMGTLEDVLAECKWRKIQERGEYEPRFVPPASEHRDLKIRPVALQA